ncbi:MAG: carboxypeptidase-like regulatory domain-containing protein, partial [Fidelibacterota bacterium]
MIRSTAFIAAVVLTCGNVLTAGVTGKIAGTVIDSESREQLIGANIIVEDTDFGAASDVNGYFVILNVPPGAYNVRASMIGYADYTIQGIRVEIDLTTTIQFEMTSEILAAEEIVVTAERRIIREDVAGSQKSITSDRIGELPAVGIEDVLGLEAGITSDLGIRGSGRDQALFMVDGVVLRDERDNNPITQIPLSAVGEISVQTGGFGAEYHNVRSGVVNVVTKEGHPKYYTGTISVKQSPPGPKHFGISPYDPDAFWLRPYLDDEVAWTGTTNGAWDLYDQRQYPSFEGWNAVSERTLQDDDPTNDLSPAAAQRLFRWEHRKEGDIRESDYNIDAGFGGPVPFIGKSLGNLRFYLSTRAEKDMYLIPTNRDALTNNTWMIKVASDLSSSTKLTLVGLYGKTLATSFTGFGREPGGTSYFRYDWEIASTIDRIGHTLSWRLYTNDYWARTAIFTNVFSARLTRIVSPRTYYELFLERVEKNYRTGPGRARSDELTELFPGYFVNEAPFGYEKFPVFAIGDGMGMGGSVSTSRDTSTFATWKARFNYFSQINQRNQLSAGFELIYDHFDLRFGAINWALPEGNTWTEFSRSPIRGSVFIQDKLETKGFIGILGMNLEYIDPNGEWYVVDPYDASFLSSSYSPDKESEFATERAEAHFYWSPRLGISHPITVNSKLYFNYGHFRQMPSSDRLYRIQRGSGYVLDRIGDPTLPLARTISYELGYDQALADRYLLHIAAYYKDVSDQQDWTRFINIKGNVNYLRLINNSYEDICGLEIDLSKNVGRWFTGNINYEYRVNTWGEFGFPVHYENPADQRNY